MGWRVLDARWFGVPQRRRRVFLVGRLGAPCPPEVLVEPAGLLGDPAPGGEAGPVFTDGTGGGVAHGLRVPSHGAAYKADSQDDLVIDHRDAGDLAGILGGGSGKRGWCSDVERMTFVPETARTLTAHGGPHGRIDGDTETFVPDPAVRRLTPTECERLQGFDDGHTCLCGAEPYSTWACRCPDGPRYAALGNAVAVPCVWWIGARLLRAHHNGT